MRALRPVVLAAVLASALQVPLRGHDGLREQIASLTVQLAAEPSRADLHLRRGELRREAGALRDARTDLERATLLDPALAALPLAWARLHLDERHPADAVRSATDALAVQPRNVAALRLRAQAYVQVHDRRRAQEDLTRIIELTPLPDTVIERARLIAEEPERLADALASVEDGIRRIGPVVTLQLEAIELEHRLGRIDAALRRIDSIVAATPRPETWLARRGELLEDAHRTNEALAAYRAALAAVDRLPAHARTARATGTLVSDLHHRIDRLSAGISHPSAGRSPSR